MKTTSNGNVVSIGIKKPFCKQLGFLSVIQKQRFYIKLSVGFVIYGQ